MTQEIAFVVVIVTAFFGIFAGLLAWASTTTASNSWEHSPEP